MVMFDKFTPPIGYRTGRWKVVAYAEHGLNGSRQVVITCECGTSVTMTISALLRPGSRKSCGCSDRRKQVSAVVEAVRPGVRFGRWTVLAPAESRNRKKAWTCQCACTNQTVAVVCALNLVNGTSKSCGCLKKELINGLGFGVIPSEKSGLRDNLAAMHTCNNCENSFDSNNEGLVTMHKATVAAAVCGDCMRGSTLVKMVLRRGDIGSWQYEQFQTLEVRKPAKAAV